jgi:hypothetical protein
MNKCHYLPIIIVALFPPKPKELERTVLIVMSFLILITGLTLSSGIRVLWFRVGKTVLCLIERIEYIHSITPAAARVCPVYPLVELNN